MIKDAAAEILRFFYAHPQEHIHIRALARKTGLHPNSVISATDDLQEQGLLHKRHENSRVIIRADTSHPYFALRKRAYHIEQLYRTGLIQYLQEVYFQPTIILFGSLAKGDDRVDSDVDLFIITDSPEEVDLAEYESILGRSIQLFLHRPESWRELIRTGPELANNVLNGIILEGYLEVFP